MGFDSLRARIVTVQSVVNGDPAFDVAVFVGRPMNSLPVFGQQVDGVTRAFITLNSRSTLFRKPFVCGPVHPVDDG